MSWQVHAQMEKENWAPWSEVRWEGTLKRDTQCLMRAYQQVSMVMLTRGTYSSILLDLPMMVNRYQNPFLETDKGPKMSMWM